MISKETKETIARLREKYHTTPETNPDAIAGMKEYWSVIEEYRKKELANNPTTNTAEGQDKTLIWNQIMEEADKQKIKNLPSKKTKETIAQLEKDYGVTPETNPEAIAGMKKYWKTITDYQAKGGGNNYKF